MNRCGDEPPQSSTRAPSGDRGVHHSRADSLHEPHNWSCELRNFTVGTYLGFKAMSQCRNPSAVITPSSGRRSEVSLLIAVEESKDIDRPARVTGCEGVGITICSNMLNGRCGSWSEGRLSRAVSLFTLVIRKLGVPSRFDWWTAEFGV